MNKAVVRTVAQGEDSGIPQLEAFMSISVTKFESNKKEQDPKAPSVLWTTNRPKLLFTDPMAAQIIERICVDRQINVWSAESVKFVNSPSRLASILLTSTSHVRNE